MPVTRRQLLLAGAGGLTASAGCSALSDPQQSLLIAVNNYSDVPRQGFVSIERDGTELVRQYVEIGAAEGEGWTTVETRVTLGKLPNGTRLDVTVSFGDGLEAESSIALTCASTSQYEGDGVYVQLDAERELHLRHWCYSGFPSSEAEQGGVNRT